MRKRKNFFAVYYRNVLCLLFTIDALVQTITSVPIHQNILPHLIAHMLNII